MALPEERSLVVMESTIPADMTIGEWRRGGRGPGSGPVEGDCDHLHDTTTRYDPTEKQLTFLMVCPVCGTERPVETVDYEPRPQIGATVHQIPRSRGEQPLRRAA